MRTALAATCVLALGSAACGRIGYDRVPSTDGAGGSGATGGTGSGGSAGASGGAGTTGTGGSSGASGTGGALVVDGGSCVDAGGPCGAVRLQYQAGDTNKPNDAWIRPQINLINDSGTDLPLSELLVRYWYTLDSVAPQAFMCDAAVFGNSGCANVTGSFAAVSPPRAGADTALEIGFLPAAGLLVAGGQTQGIVLRAGKTDFSNYNEPGDYSYDASFSNYTDAPRITVYRNGTLIWGVEPH
jgi:hypothetical protein